MREKKNKVLIILLLVSLAANIYFGALAFRGSLSRDTISADSSGKKVAADNKTSAAQTSSVEPTANAIMRSESERNRELLQRFSAYGQLFFGKWKVTHYVSADFILPDSYTGFDERGNFRGMDYSSIEGETIEFRNDYVKYNGQKYEYDFGPYVYTLALPPEDDRIGYNYAESLGITGEYYSMVVYATPENFLIVGPNPNRVKKMHLYDLNRLYLKDENTIYASDGVLTYELKRIAP